jgi:hypothetical protein
MKTGCVLFEVRTELLNIIYTDLGFKGLNCKWAPLDFLTNWSKYNKLKVRVRVQRTLNLHFHQNLDLINLYFQITLFSLYSVYGTKNVLFLIP